MLSINLMFMLCYVCMHRSSYYYWVRPGGPFSDGSLDSFKANLHRTGKYSRNAFRSFFPVKLRFAPLTGSQLGQGSLENAADDRGLDRSRNGPSIKVCRR